MRGATGSCIEIQAVSATLAKVAKKGVDVSTQTQQARPLDLQVIGRRILAVVIDYFILGLALGTLFFLFSSIFPNSPLVTAVQGSPPIELGRSLLSEPFKTLARDG